MAAGSKAPASITEEKIRSEIQRIEAQRQAFTDQANQQIAAMTGAIKALHDLLEPPQEDGQELPQEI
jgi:hypothetical protein